VPRMARTDNVWSQCAVFTIGALISIHVWSPPGNRDSRYPF
jgi:hypothetical protein